MNHPPPLDRTHATGVPPLYLTPPEVGDIPTAKNTKRTQATARPHPQTRETNPIYRTTGSLPSRPSPQICETNPIYARKYTKRTQFHPGPRPKYTKRTQLPHTNCPPTPLIPLDFAKRTQFPTTNIHSTIYNIQSFAPIPAYQVSRHPIFMRNEPNLPRPRLPDRRLQPPICETNPISAYRPRLAGFPPTFSAKRTQFPAPPASCRASHSRAGGGLMFQDRLDPIISSVLCSSFLVRSYGLVCSVCCLEI